MTPPVRAVQLSGNRLKTVASSVSFFRVSGVEVAVDGGPLTRTARRIRFGLDVRFFGPATAGQVVCTVPSFGYLISRQILRLR